MRPQQPSINSQNQLAQSPRLEGINFILKALNISLPISGRAIGEGLSVTEVSNSSAELLLGEKGEAVLLSCAVERTLHPVALFFLSNAEPRKFGSTSLLVPADDSPWAPQLQQAAVQFFTRSVEEILFALKPSWVRANFTAFVNKPIFWSERPDLSASIKNIVLKHLGEIPNIPVFPSVYPYNNPYWRHLLDAAADRIQNHEKVLVMGCGVGLEAALLALQLSNQVDAVDINPLAIANSQLTCHILNASEKVRAWTSDLFSTVEAEYDCILFNAPLAVNETRPQDPNRFDPNGRLLRAFLTELPNHLRPSGRAYLMGRTNVVEVIPQGLGAESLKTFHAGTDVGIFEIRPTVA